MNLHYYENFLKFIGPYLDKIETDPYYIHPKYGKTLLMRLLVAYLNESVRNIIGLDRGIIGKAIDILLESGIDPTRKELSLEGKEISPLLYVKARDKGLYEEMLNTSLLAPSSFESVAFENKLSNFLNKVGSGITKAAKGIATGLAQGASLPDRLSKAITNGPTLKEAKALANSLTNSTETEETSLTGDPIKDYKNIKSSEEKKLYIINNLPDKISYESKVILSEALFKQANPFTSDLYKVVKDIDTDISKEIAKLLVNPNYPGLVRELAKVGTKGLANFNSPQTTDQLKVIAFFTSKKWDTDTLRAKGSNKWLSSTGMKTVVNRIDSRVIQPKRQAPWREITPQEIDAYLEKLPIKVKIGKRTSTGKDLLREGDKTVKGLVNLFAQLGVTLDAKTITLPKLKSVKKYPEGAKLNEVLVAEKKRFEK